MPSVMLYDTTLRDGAQREGIAFSLVDKLNITRTLDKLDKLGIHFIEGGWPGSNPKDTEFFSEVGKLNLQNSVLVAFGSTRRPKTKVESGTNVLALIKSGVTTVAIVGKSSALHVTKTLETSLEENLRMIADSTRYLKSKGLVVFFDAEHFFDGYKEDSHYALKTLAAAASAGADYLILCDTNGGSLPDEITKMVEAARKQIDTPLGIHAHNDSELAVSNTLAAVQAGVSQVQGTINGYGERCGNANLCSIIPILKLKMNLDCISDEQLAELTGISRYISEIANLAPDPFQPYVGSSAFAHKGGYHAAAVKKWEGSYQHVKPLKVGNNLKVIISELSGTQSIKRKASELGFDLTSDDVKVREVLEQVKVLESQGFQYEGAEASFELLLHRSLPDYQPLFQLVDFLVLSERRRRPNTRNRFGEMLAEAIVKVQVGTELMHTAAEGNGPVNALDKALRKALVQFYPGLARVKLVDYKVRILEESTGTESKVRVLIESGDGAKEWRTVGSSTDIIEASWLALADSLEYWLIKNASV